MAIVRRSRHPDATLSNKRSPGIYVELTDGPRGVHVVAWRREPYSEPKMVRAELIEAPFHVVADLTFGLLVQGATV